MPHVITQELIDNAYTYESYRAMIDENFAHGKTTGDNHSKAMLHYTKMNIQRMKRLDKTSKISGELTATIKQITEPQVWLIITEAWCGDAAQSLSTIQKAASLNDKIQTRYILRDEHPEVMDAYLFNGTRSIPKVIILKADTLEEIGHWGPRPVAAQEIVDEHKALGSSHEVYVELVHKWYNTNKTVDIQDELNELLKK